jgi:hypothetical protein
MPYLPPEIIPLILATPNIDLARLLRSARVSKEWQTFIYDSNTLRAKLFLPQRSASGSAVEVKNPRYTAPAKVSIKFDPNLESRQPSQALKAESPLNMVAIHLILLRDRVLRHNEDDMCSVSYRLLKKLYRFKEQGTTSWQAMCITEPPISTVTLVLRRSRCDEPNAHTTKIVSNAPGVTLIDVYNAFMSTYLPWNLGIVPDDGSCAGKTWPDEDPDSAVPSCRCYDLIGSQERSDMKVRELEAEVARLKRLKELHEEEVRIAEEIVAEKEARMQSIVREIDEIRAEATAAAATRLEPDEAVESDQEA